MARRDLESDVNELYDLIRKAEGLEEPKKNRILELLDGVAMYDPLTGLLNKTFLDLKLNEEISRMKRHKHPTTVVMADIDYFKRYNDTFGHSQGDEALRYVGRIFRSNRRPEDIIGRYGGEEFTLILPETDEKGAIKVVENIFERMKSIKIGEYMGLNNSSDKKYFEGRGFQDLTMSLGVTVFPTRTKDPTFLINDADQALYDAKKSGKNKFIFYNPQPIEL